MSFIKSYRARVSNIVAATTEDEFKDYVGTDAYKFIQVRENMLNGKSINWSWAGFLLGPIWIGYRKSWSTLVGNCFGVVALAWFGMLLCHVLTGLYGKSGYIISVSQKIIAIKQFENDPARLKMILTARGGTSILGGLLAFVIYTCSIALSMALVLTLFGGTE